MYNPLVQVMMQSAEKHDPIRRNTEWFRQMICEKRARKEHADVDARFSMRATGPQSSLPHDAEWFKQTIYEKRAHQEQLDAQPPMMPIKKRHSIQLDADVIEAQRTCKQRLGARFSRWFGHLLIKTGRRMLQHAC